MSEAERPPPGRHRADDSRRRYFTRVQSTIRASCSRPTSCAVAFIPA